MRFRNGLVASSGLIALALLTATPTIGYADVDPTPPPVQDEVIHIPLSAPLSLEDAEQVASSVSSDVVGYYYDNGPVVGEFFPGKVSDSEFISDFADDYGTEPAITQLVAVAPVTAPNAAQKANSEREVHALPHNTPTLTIHRKAFKPAAVSAKKLKTMFAKSAARTNTAKAVATDAADPDSPDAFAHGTWAPKDVVVYIERSGSHQTVENDITWSSTASQNGFPDKFGMEVQADFINPSLSDTLKRTSSQVSCNPTPRDTRTVYRYAYFIGLNYSWNSWSATSSSGKVGAAKAYADYNDLSNACNLQDLTIGFRYPELIPGVSLITKIDADTGGVSSNTISGELQLVHDDCGDSNGSGVGGLTDCMGLSQIAPPASAHNPRKTLSDSRSWKASPYLCWDSAGYGGSTPVKVDCE